MVAAAWLLLLCATTLVVATLAYGDAVAVGGLRRAVLDHPVADRSIVIRTSGTGQDLDTLDPVVSAALEQSIASTGGEVALIVGSGALELPGDAGAAGDGGTREGSLLASYAGIEDHATIVDGRWPVAGASPAEAALPAAAAADLGLAVGDRVSLVTSPDRSLRVDVVVTGTWRAEPSDPYWLESPLELEGTLVRGPFTTRGPFTVALADVRRLFGGRRLDLQWRAVPDIQRLTIEGYPALRDDVAALQPSLGAALPRGQALAIATQLPAILDTVEDSVVVSRAGMLVLGMQFAVLAGYAVLLIAGMLLDRRRPEVALLRSRGASTTHLVALALGEALLLALPVALVAPLFATVVVDVLSRVGPLAGSGVVSATGPTPALWMASALAATGCVLVLAIPTVLAREAPASARAASSRQTGRTLAQRLGFDVALLVLALVGLWQLRLYGAPLTRQARGALGVDPLLVAAPAIGLLAGAILATRIVPRLAAAAERPLARRNGLVGPLGVRQLARRPLRYTRSALLLMLAAALGTFAVSEAATWTRSQGDQATYQSAADLRVALGASATLGTQAVGAALRDLPGVTAAAPVSFQRLDAGRTVDGGQLLLVDPATVGRTLHLPADPGAATVPELLTALGAARPDLPGSPIEGKPRHLRVTLDSRLHLDEMLESPPTDVAWPPVKVSVVLQDGDGQLYTLDAGDAQATGGLQVVLVELADGGTAPTYPVRLMAVSIQVQSPEFLPTSGTIDLVKVEASDAATADAAGESGWRAVPVGGAPAAWRWDRVDLQGTTTYLPKDSPTRISLGFSASTDSGVIGTALFRLTARVPQGEAVPAIAGSRFLEDTGIRVGDTIDIGNVVERTTVHIVGSTELFPPLDPSTPFLVVDGTSFAAARFSATGFTTTPSEWWLSVEPGRSAVVASTVRAEPFSATAVTSRESLAAQLAADPVPLGVIGALTLGSIAALVFAGIGFLVSVAVLATERIGEFALLEALGLPTRQLAGWLTVESAILLVFGLVSGTVLGLVLAWLVLPFAALTASGAPAVPPAVVVIPWPSLLPMFAVGAVLLVLAVAVARRQLPRIRISGVLRARDD